MEALRRAIAEFLVQKYDNAGLPVLKRGVRPGIFSVPQDALLEHLFKEHPEREAFKKYAEEFRGSEAEDKINQQLQHSATRRGGRGGHQDCVWLEKWKKQKATWPSLKQLGL